MTITATKSRLDYQRPEDGNLLTLIDRVGGHESGNRIGLCPVIGRFHKPPSYIIERLPAFRPTLENALEVFFLLFRLPCGAEIGRVSVLRSGSPRRRLISASIARIPL